MKTCTKCGNCKPLTEFYRVKKRWLSEYQADCKACVRARANEYYQNNRVKVLAREEARRASMDWSEMCRQYKRKQWQKALLHCAIKCSKDRGHEPPTIDEAWILAQPLVCPYLNVPLDLSGKGQRQPWTPSLDRIDNSKGYTPDNVRLTSWVWNLMRGSLTVGEALEVLAVMRTATLSPGKAA